MAVDTKDYYKILGVAKNADQKEIRQTYRKLARKHHPDVNPGDKTAEDRFKEINEANEVLSDPEKRKKYDEINDYYQQYGHWPGAGNATSAGGAGDGYEQGQYQYRTVNEDDLRDLFGDQSPFSDFFGTYFGDSSAPRGSTSTTGGRRQRATVGQDVEATIEVSLDEAYKGTSRSVELTESDGSSRRLEVKIPAGVDEGSRIRIAGQGLQGANGRGDLYLRVHLLPSSAFTREGNDLRTRVEVPLASALLGGEIHVPTPDGRRLMLRIPPETNNGRTFRLRSQGMPHLGKPEQRGDLFAEVTVVLPTHLTDEQRRLFESFARSLGDTEHE